MVITRMIVANIETQGDLTYKFHDIELLFAKAKEKYLFLSKIQHCQDWVARSWMKSLGDTYPAERHLWSSLILYNAIYQLIFSIQRWNAIYQIIFSIQLCNAIYLIIFSIQRYIPDHIFYTTLQRYIPDYIFYTTLQRYTPYYIIQYSAISNFFCNEGCWTIYMSDFSQPRC